KRLSLGVGRLLSKHRRQESAILPHASRSSGAEPDPDRQLSNEGADRKRTSHEIIVPAGRTANIHRESRHYAPLHEKRPLLPATISGPQRGIEARTVIVLDNRSVSEEPGWRSAKRLAKRLLETSHERASSPGEHEAGHTGCAGA